MSMKISLKQRRFLIVWGIFHLFALTVNMIPVEGLVHISGKIWTKTNPTGIDAHYVNVERPLYIFTYPDHSAIDGNFWPFVKMWEADYLGSNSYNDDSDMYTGRFKGLFYNYSYKAFIVYILIGLAIVFLPKLWSGGSDKLIQKELPGDGKIPP